MKNIVAVLGCLFVMGILPICAQTNSELWDGNLTERQVVSKLRRCEFLPLFINDAGAFSSAEQKASIAKIAVEQAGKCKSYAGYFNAAVVYFTQPEEFDFDSFVPLNAHDAANAIRFANKAIELSPNTPHMFFLRGSVLLDQGAVMDVTRGEYEIVSHEAAHWALQDFEKVAELNPSKAPYMDMALLAKALKQYDKASRYERMAKAREEAIERQLKGNLSQRGTFNWKVPFWQQLSTQLVFPLWKGVRK